MHIYLKESKTTVCSKCGKPVLAHTVCHGCGYYKGREVLDVLRKLTKKEKKQKEKEMKAQDKEKAQEKSLSWEGMSKK